MSDQTKTSQPFTSPASQPNPNLKGFDAAKEEAQRKADAEALAKSQPPTVSDDAALAPSIVKPSAPKEEMNDVPRAIRAIASSGNVLKADSWPWKRDPTENEKADFLRQNPGAERVDVVNAK